MPGDRTSDPDTLDTTCRADEPLSETLPSDSVTDETVRLLKGFANETRLQILCLLRGRELCVHDIVEVLDVSQSAVSHQLRLLRDAHLVTSQREGRHMYYRLADEHVREMLKNAISHGAEGQE